MLSLSTWTLCEKFHQKLFACSHSNIISSHHTSSPSCTNNKSHHLEWVNLSHGSFDKDDDGLSLSRRSNEKCLNIWKIFIIVIHPDCGGGRYRFEDNYPSGFSLSTNNSFHLIKTWARKRERESERRYINFSQLSIFHSQLHSLALLLPPFFSLHLPFVAFVFGFSLCFLIPWYMVSLFEVSTKYPLLSLSTVNVENPLREFSSFSDLFMQQHWDAKQEWRENAHRSVHDLCSSSFHFCSSRLIWFVW